MRSVAVVELVLFPGRSCSTFANLLAFRRRVDLVPEAPSFRELLAVLGLHPIDDRDVDVGFAGPGLVVDGFDDRAAGGDVVEAADAGLVVADVLRADQPRPAGHRIVGRTLRQVVVRLAKP